MINRRIRSVIKALVCTAFMAGLFVAEPAYSLSWFTWSKQEKSESPVYVTPESKAKPKRTWAEYLFGEKAKPVEKPVYNRPGPAPIAGDEPREYKIQSAEQIIARGRELSLPHHTGLMRMSGDVRARIAEAERKHRMRMTEMMAKSRRETDAQRQAEGDGPMSMPAEDDAEKKVIYVKPGTVKPQKVFTDFQ
jgi:hypothetical protein